MRVPRPFFSHAVLIASSRSDFPRSPSLSDGDAIWAKRGFRSSMSPSMSSTFEKGLSDIPPPESNTRNSPSTSPQSFS